MATVIWDMCGIIYVDKLENDKNMKKEYNFNLLDSFNTAVKEKYRDLTKKMILFHRENVRCIVA